MTERLVKAAREELEAHLAFKAAEDHFEKTRKAYDAALLAQGSARRAHMEKVRALAEAVALEPK